MIELLAGCGRSRKRAVRGPQDPEGWDQLVTLDIDPNVKADVEWDLNRRIPLPFDDDHFDALHFYEVLEHTGQQGDWKFFFWQFSDFWRILKPGGRLIGTSPAADSKWLWGDPGHSRVISPECLSFLVQPMYGQPESQMTDYRHVYRADFQPVHHELKTDGKFLFVMEAVKPSRIKR